MATNLPSNLYAGNAVHLDSTPYTNFAINQLAQKQAKKEAVDKYYTDQFSKINGKGLSPEEQEALLGTKNNMLNYYNQNKDSIQKGDVAARTGVDQYLSKMQDIIGRGQYKTEQNKMLYGIQKSPESSSLITTTAAENMKHSSASIYRKGKNGEYELNEYDPVTNPNGYKEFDPNQALFNAKPYTAPQMLDQSTKFQKATPPDNFEYQPLVLPDGKKSATQMVGIPKYSDNKVKDYMAQWENAYHQDDKLSTTVDKAHPFADGLPENAPYFDAANDFYKKYTGNNITNGGQLLAATEGMKLLAPRAAEKPIMNQDAKDKLAYDREVSKSLLNDKLARGRQENAHRLKLDGGVETPDAWGGLEEKNRQLAEAKANGGKYHDENGVLMERTKVATLPDGSKSYYIPYNSIMSSPTKTALNKVLTDQGIVTSGDDIMLVPNKQGGNDVFDVDPQDGKKATMYRTTITKQDIQLAASKGQPERQTTLKKTTQQTAPTKVATPKTLIHTRNEYKSAGWTDAQINTALKAGKIQIK